MPYVNSSPLYCTHHLLATHHSTHLESPNPPTHHPPFKTPSLSSFANSHTMAVPTLPLLLLLVLFVTTSSHLTYSVASDADNYLEAACSMTLHRALCMQSLESFSHSAAWKQKQPCWWARAAVAVTLMEAKHVSRYLAKAMHGGRMEAKHVAALTVCVECFGEALAQLRSSLGELQRLERRTFEYQMNDVETWVSAALASQDTCLEGFGEHEGKEVGEVGEVKAKVLNATYFTSIALALIDSLATSGGT